ncbi:hypothetical protein V1264_016261 [Littorina saxatilis]|uniref:Reverse transcriptase n=2 Tax=Littorina saxatilis TaxID=31220 RepID=A0AAN9GGY3_9CAEN
MMSEEQQVASGVTTRSKALELTKELMEKGEMLGLTGAELREYVIEQEREAKKFELEQIQQQVEREREAKQMEREERARDKEHEFRLEELRIQAEASRPTNSGGGNSNNSSNHTQQRDRDNYQSKLPFLEDKDDIESFIFQFEDHARANHWSNEIWLPRLTALLKGKARLAYTRLTDDERGSYELLKKALLEHFQITAETYRKKFRSRRKEQADTYKHLINDLSLFMDRWIDMSGHGSDVESLKDLFLREQLMEILPENLATYIKDREPEDISAIKKLIVRYEEARPSASKKTRDDKGSVKEKDSHRFEARKASGKYDDKSQSGKVADKDKPYFKKDIRCFHCNGPHFKRECPKLREDAGAAMDTKVKVGNSTNYDKLCGTCAEKTFTKVSKITVEGRLTTGFRDTGSTSTIVDAALVPDANFTSSVKETTLADKSTKKQLRIARVHLDTPYFVGETEVSVMDNPIYSVLIGNQMGLQGETVEVPVYPVRDPVIVEGSAAVETRDQRKRDAALEAQIPLVPQAEQLFSAADLKKEQRADESLSRLHVLAETKVTHGRVSFTHVKDVLYRQYVDKEGKEHRQVVVPRKMRSKVLRTGHDSPMAGHLGQKKTRERIWQEFFWPGIVGDIKRHCMSCDACQRTSPKGRTKRVPMGRMPVIDTAFKRVAVDLVGPIKPISASKKQYILVMVDYATRYPEAVALRDIKASTIAEALWNFWTRLGLPDEILSDRGTQFTSELMKDVQQLLAIKGLTTTPWHPQTNGLVERFNGTLKSMLKKLAMEQPEKWDEFIPALLFAYREVPQDSLGFSPFELLYGRTVKGPMQILRQLWTEEGASDEAKTTAEYVTDLRNRIEETCEIARDHLAKAALRQAHHYDRNTKRRTLEVGAKVLLLLPTKHNKLELAWRGPYAVEEKVNAFDYRIKVGRNVRTYHVNLLREYHERDKMFQAEHTPEEEEEEHIAIVVEDYDEVPNDYFADADSLKHIPTPSTKRTEFAKDVHIWEKLNRKQRKDIEDACQEFGNNLTDVPKQTTLEKCVIKVTEKKPVYVKPRPIPHSQVDVVEREVKEMLELGVIEPAASPYNSPIVLVKKADGKSIRFCNDLREVNKVVQFDAEPITDVEHLFSELSHARFFSKIDLTKGYWAVMIQEEDRDKTAFTTPLGQFRWVNMPFGLSTAGAIFNRMMRKLLLPLNRKDVHHFMDDILIATETWEQHIEAVRAVLKRLQEANLAAKPSKCFFGYEQLSYLGHEIGNGKRWPEDDKVKKIRDAKPPETKKELRAYLGTTGFYRSYIAGYSDIAAPLTDKTKKHEPEHVKWNQACQVAFDKLKEGLTNHPVVIMPDLALPYVVRTDASDRGMGAVLLQDQGKGLQPVAYASKKLNSAEQNYATVEKECLATVWGIQKFERYLYGRHFVLETDHQPLQYLQRMKPTNARLMRWALQLQPYDFTIKVIPGKDNVGADYLSRMTTA